MSERGRGARVLVMRFSALGDVAMTVPVVWSAARRYPDAEITFLSRGDMASVYSLMPENVRFVEADLKGRHRGVRGLCRLLRELRAERFTHVADLHGVLRSHFLRWAYALRGVRCACIEKGRAEKRRLVKRGWERSERLKGSIARYEEVFGRLGFEVKSNFGGFSFEEEAIRSVGVELPGRGVNIGIAPFARHDGKMYPYERMGRLIGAAVGSRDDVHVYLFGAGEGEKARCAMWESEFEGRVTSVVGRYSIKQEIMFMSRLDVMLTMDSANMHLAALSGVKVMSIWMATHPYAGFLGYGMSDDESTVIGRVLPCRPCSVFGDKPCRFGKEGYFCREIDPEDAARRVVARAAEGCDAGGGEEKK